MKAQLFHSWITQQITPLARQGDKKAQQILADYQNLTIFQFEKKYNHLTAQHSEHHIYTRETINAQQ